MPGDLRGCPRAPGRRHRCPAAPPPGQPAPAAARAMLSASQDRWRRGASTAAGCTLHRSCAQEGQVDRSALPVVPGVREAPRPTGCGWTTSTGNTAAGRTGRTTGPRRRRHPARQHRPRQLRLRQPAPPGGARRQDGRPPGGCCGSAWPVPRAPSWPPHVTMASAWAVDVGPPRPAHARHPGLPRAARDGSPRAAVPPRRGAAGHRSGPRAY